MIVSLFADAVFGDNVLAKIKPGRPGTVEDPLDAVPFPASGGAGLIAGTSLVVDGGWPAD